MANRYFIGISYDGGAYSGWQSQPNAKTIQQTIEDALYTIRRKITPILGAGRTDAGVHARGMVAHLDLDENIDEATILVDKLNRLIPSDISITSIRSVHNDAHARFDAIARTYHYYVTEKKNPFHRRTMLKMYKPLNFDMMNKAASCLLNYKDFTSFSKLHTDVKTNICNISEAYWSKDLQEDVWVFTITADRFLRNMVRAIVGTLFNVGWGKIGIEEFCRIVEAKDRCRAGSSADAHALFLDKVLYPY